MFVIAALVEYAVLIKIRYGNASARLVKARLMLMAKKLPPPDGEVCNFECFPQLQGGPKGYGKDLVDIKVTVPFPLQLSNSCLQKLFHDHLDHPALVAE